MNTSITPEQAQVRRKHFENRDVAPFYTMSDASKYANQGDVDQKQTDTRQIKVSEPNAAEAIDPV